MHFSHMHPDTGSKAGKFAIVAGLHALIAVGVVNMLNNKVMSLPSLPDDLTVFLKPEPPVPPPVPPDPPTPMPQVAPPHIVVPKLEIEVPPPPVDNPVQATTTDVPPTQEPAQPMQAEVPAKPATPTTSSGATRGEMRSAVLADARSCVTPNYPAAAARNGDSGTVMLALLVGADGRVTSSRIQKSSGSRELDRAAVNALSLCRFKPAMNNGVPEAGWGQIAYVWTLD
jgi:protein TonB